MIEVKRPWGNFKLFALNKNCTVKIITIKPNQSLSLQYHKRRRETLFFLTDGIIQIGKKNKKIRKGEMAYIPKKQMHRIMAKKRVVMALEISYGKFKETDEVRLKDKYGRN